MGANHHRRDFLKTAAGTGAALGLANLDFLDASATGFGRGGEARSEQGAVWRRHRAARPAVGRHAARARARRGRRASQEGAGLQATSGGDSVGRRPRYSAAARWLQVSCRAGRELGPSGEPRLARRASLAADLLGDRRLQIVAGAERQEGNWTMQAVDEKAVVPGDKAAAAFAARWTMGRIGRRRRRCRPGPVRQAGGNLRDLLSLWHARFPRHRPQGDLRRQQLAGASADRLATCRAGAAVAGLCAA